MFKEKPALHRYPGSMAKRTHALCVHVVEEYDGDAEKIWKGVQDPQVLFDRIRALPGYGDEKAKIFLAILGKRLKVAPKGWEEYAAPFSDANPRSVADIDSRENLRAGARLEAGAEGPGEVEGRVTQTPALSSAVLGDRLHAPGTRSTRPRSGPRSR